MKTVLKTTSMAMALVTSLGSATFAAGALDFLDSCIKTRGDFAEQRQAYFAKVNLSESSIDTLTATPEFKAAWLIEVRKQARPLFDEKIAPALRQMRVAERSKPANRISGCARCLRQSLRRCRQLSTADESRQAQPCDRGIADQSREQPGRDPHWLAQCWEANSTTRACSRSTKAEGLWGKPDSVVIPFVVRGCIRIAYPMKDWYSLEDEVAIRYEIIKAKQGLAAANK